MNQQLLQLQQKLKEQHITYYLIPSEDPHQSEYVDEHYKCRQFISEFTGSAGTLLVGVDSCYLWTDGRYFTQAEEQINSTQIQLMKSAVSGVPTISDFLKSHLKHNDILGVNGTTISTSYGKQLENLAQSCNASFQSDFTFVEDIWTDRPEKKQSEIFFHDISYAGEEVSSKLSSIRERLAEIKIDSHFLSALPDIAWLFNLRGDDMECTPLFYSYAYITEKECHLFLNISCLTTKALNHLEENQIILHEYDEVEAFLNAQERSVFLDPDTTNYDLYHILKKNNMALGTNPSTPLKAIRNEIQVENLRKCHLYDGVAMTKFMYWLKTNIGKIPMTEISVSDYLEELRKIQPDYHSLSFETICAYKEHAAMMHYCSTKDSDVELKPEGMLLIDSGGQYFSGTTDITRTFILGPVSDEEKKNFTIVCKCMLNLANAKFLLGCRGSNLDILSRGPLWEHGIDYRCGTGHGVGYFLGVHEGPNAFRWQTKADRLDAILRPGMVTTDEPGVYVPGKYGIRTENMLLCKKQKQNEYGSFLEFEPLTLVPIDMDGIDFNYFDEEDKKRLREYHKMVWDIISPHLSDEERNWLKEFIQQ
ncbi:MAG: aminopeptidase family protein P [Anaerostipes sp.]|nr:aminopeptidase family protein P [Anaerostipes sp.]